MIKRCAECGIEIADTDYDSQQRFARVTYCDECIAERRRRQKNISQSRIRQRKRAERELQREKQLLTDAEDVISIREQAKSIRERTANLRHGMTEEQRLRAELKKSERQVEELRNHIRQDACSYLNLLQKSR